ncbi:UNVERIFIED_CONTAM: hypothetical protein PYX00_003819 [Menopon gallinae]|uniref:Deltamethrin resistance protein prag01 domain-containing protein n=1 Tax=Menopon gallinae TaxID=328185 RepID=A0AAW2I422_9NEOP
MSHYDKPPADYVYPTFDEVPGPCGDWQQHYDQNQRKYNLVLLVGVGVFAITVAVAYSSGLFWCNFFPPEKPAPKVPCSK